MDNFDFCNPVRVVFGKGMIARLSTLIPVSERVLLLYGGGSIRKNGVYDQVVNALQGHRVVEFGGVEANPHYETCMQAVELVRKEKLTFILAVGGGSVVDAAKFIAASVCFEGDPWAILSEGKAIEQALPIGAVITLAATGSEMNHRAVITRVSSGEKLNFASPKVYPQFAVLDPEVTYSLPLRQVANGVVDSFIHVIEQYLTYPVNAKVQDAFSEVLMTVIVEEGRKVLKDSNNYDIRANLMWAATNALNGWIGQGVPQDWSSHRIGYAMTAQFGLDHAQTLAVILPGVMTYMQKEKAEKIMRLGEVVFDITEGEPRERVLKSIEACESFFREMGIQTRLSDYGIRESDLDSLVSQVKQMDWHLGEHANIDDKVARDILMLRL
ncbi:NADP-dependent alcohol dehydrogenase [Parabacteroides sp. PFB2-10]|uniref:iron-containing alcohol dehydrogenase n=1 Tax=Parabacteroides sp. PFB2-10 TaxID=1742405 RepID=UPI0024732B2C|nr:iron-containing alcohol dehydrogenase [Parabacteroides sp. PFB2-10]MDH6312415.1 NADP-dependent alcohol dehydrogenase [Parabacteroides sp. PFB2-10]